MTWSANEVQTLVAKAARGGGAPPAQAMDFGRAAYHHLVSGCDVDDLRAALISLPAGPIMALPLALARLLEGAQDDQAQGCLDWPDAPDLARSYAASAPFECRMTMSATGVVLSVNLSQPAPRSVVTRIMLEPEFAEMLNSLAANILVPETAASRLAGAGAGLTDND